MINDPMMANSHTPEMLSSHLPEKDRPPVVLIDELAEGYFEADLDHGLTVVNRALCHMLGCTNREQLLGKASAQLFDEDNLARLTNIFRRVFETGEPALSVEMPVTGADGEPRTIEFSISALRDHNGSPSGLSGVVHDVTERARAEATLNRRFNLLTVLQQVDVELNHALALDAVLEIALNAAVLLSHADAGFIGLIDDNGVQLARAVGGFSENPMALDMGIIARVIRNQRGELIADVRADPDYYADLAETRAEIAVPLRTHGRVIGVLNVESQTPENFTAEVFEIVQLLGARLAAAIDNARLYEALQSQFTELHDLYTQVSELEQLKTDMIRIAAHDLRGPLSIVSSYIEMLHEDLEPHFDDMHEAYFEAIRIAITRMTRMTGDILSLERLQEGRDATLLRVPLLPLLEDVMLEHREEARKHSQQLDMKAEDMTVLGSASELREAMTNLVGNAIKYTADGGRIEARLHREDDCAVFEVTDNGYGIPEDQQGRLFQPFHRVRTRETRAIEGTGLGLYLVKKIVERHGGGVHFESEYGKGSTFGFRLPLGTICVAETEK